MPKDLNSSAQMCCSALSNHNIRPVIIIVDAVNQVGYKHHVNMPLSFGPHQTPILYCKTGVYRGATLFSLFLLNEAVLKSTHNICFVQR